MSENIIHLLKKKKKRKERDVFARVLSQSVISLSFKKYRIVSNMFSKYLYLRSDCSLKCWRTTQKVLGVAFIDVITLLLLNYLPNLFKVVILWRD